MNEILLNRVKLGMYEKTIHSNVLEFTPYVVYEKEGRKEGDRFASLRFTSTIQSPFQNFVREREGRKTKKKQKIHAWKDKMLRRRNPS